MWPISDIFKNQQQKTYDQYKNAEQQLAAMEESKKSLYHAEMEGSVSNYQNEIAPVLDPLLAKRPALVAKVNTLKAEATRLWNESHK